MSNQNKPYAEQIDQLKRDAEIADQRIADLEKGSRDDAQYIAKLQNMLEHAIKNLPEPHKTWATDGFNEVRREYRKTFDS